MSATKPVVLGTNARNAVTGVATGVSTGIAILTATSSNGVVGSAPLFVVNPGDNLPKDLVMRWIEESYRAQAPKKLVAELGTYEYTVEAWIDRFESWRHELVAKFDAAGSQYPIKCRREPLPLRTIADNEEAHR